MDVSSDDIYRVMESIWSSVLGLDVHPRSAQTSVDRYDISGCVYITGAWTGAVALSCSAALANHAAAIMFGLDTVASRDAWDAIAELTSITGGNLKGLLAEHCQLSLPSVVWGSDCESHVPGSRVVAAVELESQGHTFLVSVLRAGQAAA